MRSSPQSDFSGADLSGLIFFRYGPRTAEICEVTCFTIPFSFKPGYNARTSVMTYRRNMLLNVDPSQASKKAVRVTVIRY